MRKRGDEEITAFKLEEHVHTQDLKFIVEPSQIHRMTQVQARQIHFGAIITCHNLGHAAM